MQQHYSAREDGGTYFAGIQVLTSSPEIKSINTFYRSTVVTYVHYALGSCYEQEKMAAAKGVLQW
jgi:hypothetical protein